jgi:hypothetical protein
VLANPFLEAHTLTDFQTSDAVIAAVDVHENISATGVRLDESEASITSVGFHYASRHFRLRSPDTNTGFYASSWSTPVTSVTHRQFARGTCFTLLGWLGARHQAFRNRCLRPTAVGPGQATPSGSRILRVEGSPDARDSYDGHARIA